MHIERTAVADEDFGRKVANIPCHDRARDYDGLCYLSMGHHGDHVYQPRLDLFQEV